ncbi:hypothetical protein M413DRAFT_61963, partial [Hebeloma cylindrosporum]
VLLMRVNGRALLPILEPADTQGLLDRVFPDNSASLRALLSEDTPVADLAAAIANLRPISSRPRARLSPTAAQQLRFCNLALSLLQQLGPSPNSSSAHYALVQHLPSGDWWSSITSLQSPSDLHTANADLVAVLPTPSSSTNHHNTLAAYSTRSVSHPKPPPHRRVTTGVFLDYGPYSTFAPSFDQDGEIVGRHQLGQALFHRKQKIRLPRPSTPEESPTFRQDEPILDSDIEAILPPEQVDSIKAALNSLELEKSVQTLLDKNQRALKTLEKLQFERLTNHPTTVPEEHSEEWETAQAILDSLSLLASLRPRSSLEDHPAIIPPPSVLHKLHRTLALEPSPGWHGTLPPGRTTALRDDSTLKVRPGAATPAPVPAAAVAPAPAAVSATNTFGAYGYPYTQQQNYRPQQAAAYTPYKPGQAPSYYQGYVPAGSHQQQAYYNQQSYGTGATAQQPYGAATGQQPYSAYSTWYGQYNATAQGGTNSGRGTPQPVVTTPAAVPNTYGTFFNAATSAGTPATPTGVAARTPAVANTVVGTPYAGTTPTLPVHLRGSQAVTSNGGPLQSYYASSYQMQT